MAWRTRKKARPDDFHESLAPYMPAPALATPHIGPGLVRAALYSLWVVAAIAAGAGIGLWLVSQAPARTVLPGLPVATAAVNVQPVPAGTIAQAKAAGTAALKVAPSSSVEQSQAGDVWRVAPASSVQPAGQPEALQPGFTSYGYGQGTVGTAPVVKK
jgi:hypothetical protein